MVGDSPMAVSKIVLADGRTLIDLTGDTVTADMVVQGHTGHLANGDQFVGTMPNNGAQTKTMDGLTTTSVTIPAGYTTGGTVSLTDDIEAALSAI